MQESGKKVVITAIAANFAIFLTKTVAAVLSGSSSMLAEALHSLADTGNQVFLYLGIKKSAKGEDKLHPFGYGKERYFWAFVVAIMLFFMGGGFSVYEGVERFLHPKPVGRETLSLVVLSLSFVFELFSFLYVTREIKNLKGEKSLFSYLRETKRIELAVVFLEDFAAILGLVVAFTSVLLHKLTGSAFFDSAGSVVIGLLLMAVSIFLASETRSLLIGESPSEKVLRDVERILNSCDGVERVIYVKGLQLGSDYILLTAKVAFKPDLTAEEVAGIIDRAEERLRNLYPELRRIFIEADIWKGDGPV